MNDNSQDQNFIDAANALRHPTPYDAGGDNRYNCCDWITEVANNVGFRYANPNPRPFGDIEPPWWVQEWFMSGLADLTGM